MAAPPPRPGSLAPLLQSSILSGSPPPGMLAPRSPTQLPVAAAQLEPSERVRFFRGQLLKPQADELRLGRTEVSALSDAGGHGRYAHAEGESSLHTDRAYPFGAIPPTVVPERFHVRAPNGRRLFPSDRPTGREEVEQLERVYDALLEEAGDDLQLQLDARDIVFAEIARQVQPHCAERAELVRRIQALFYKHTAEALPLVGRVEAVEKALQEKREQLAAMQRDHAALTASRNRLHGSATRAFPSKHVLRAAIADESAHKVRRCAGRVRRAGTGQGGRREECAGASERRDRARAAHPAPCRVCGKSGLSGTGASGAAKGTHRRLRLVKQRPRAARAWTETRASPHSERPSSQLPVGVPPPPPPPSSFRPPSSASSAPPVCAVRPARRALLRARRPTRSSPSSAEL